MAEDEDENGHLHRTGGVNPIFDDDEDNDLSADDEEFWIRQEETMKFFENFKPQEEMDAVMEEILETYRPDQPPDNSHDPQTLTRDIGDNDTQVDSDDTEAEDTLGQLVAVSSIGRQGQPRTSPRKLSPPKGPSARTHEGKEDLSTSSTLQSLSFNSNADTTVTSDVPPPGEISENLVPVEEGKPVNVQQAAMSATGLLSSAPETASARSTPSSDALKGLPPPSPVSPMGKSKRQKAVSLSAIPPTRWDPTDLRGQPDLRLREGPADDDLSAVKLTDMVPCMPGIHRRRRSDPQLPRYMSHILSAALTDPRLRSQDQLDALISVLKVDAYPDHVHNNAALCLVKPPEVAQTLARLLVGRLCLRRGDSIYTLGSPADCFFVVLSGSVQLTDTHLKRTYLRPGALFGTEGLDTVMSEPVCTLSTSDTSNPLVSSFSSASSTLPAREDWVESAIDYTLIGIVDRQVYAKWMKAWIQGKEEELLLPVSPLQQLKSEQSNAQHQITSNGLLRQSSPSIITNSITPSSDTSITDRHFHPPPSPVSRLPATPSPSTSSSESPPALDTQLLPPNTPGYTIAETLYDSTTTGNSPLAFLSRDAIHCLVRLGAIRYARTGAVLGHQGDPVSRIVLVLKGTVAVLSDEDSTVSAKMKEDREAIQNRSTLFREYGTLKTESHATVLKKRSETTTLSQAATKKKSLFAQLEEQKQRRQRQQQPQSPSQNLSPRQTLDQGPKPPDLSLVLTLPRVGTGVSTLSSVIQTPLTGLFTVPNREGHVNHDGNTMTKKAKLHDQPGSPVKSSRYHHQAPPLSSSNTSTISTSSAIPNSPTAFLSASNSSFGSTGNGTDDLAYQLQTLGIKPADNLWVDEEGSIVPKQYLPMKPVPLTQISAIEDTIPSPRFRVRSLLSLANGQDEATEDLTNSNPHWALEGDEPATKPLTTTHANDTVEISGVDGSVGASEIKPVNSTMAGSPSLGPTLGPSVNLTPAQGAKSVTDDKSTQESDDSLKSLDHNISRKYQLQGGKHRATIGANNALDLRMGPRIMSLNGDTRSVTTHRSYQYQPSFLIDRRGNEGYTPSEMDDTASAAAMQSETFAGVFGTTHPNAFGAPVLTLNAALEGVNSRLFQLARERAQARLREMADRQAAFRLLCDCIQTVHLQAKAYRLKLLGFPSTTTTSLGSSSSSLVLGDTSVPPSVPSLLASKMKGIHRILSTYANSGELMRQLLRLDVIAHLRTLRPPRRGTVKHSSLGSLSPSIARASPATVVMTTSSSTSQSSSQAPYHGLRSAAAAEAIAALYDRGFPKWDHRAAARKAEEDALARAKALAAPHSPSVIDSALLAIHRRQFPRGNFVLSASFGYPLGDIEHLAHLTASSSLASSHVSPPSFSPPRPSRASYIVTSPTALLLSIPTSSFFQVLNYYGLYKAWHDGAMLRRAMYYHIPNARTSEDIALLDRHFSPSLMSCSGAPRIFESPLIRHRFFSLCRFTCTQPSDILVPLPPPAVPALAATVFESRMRLSPSASRKAISSMGIAPILGQVPLPNSLVVSQSTLATVQALGSSFASSTQPSNAQSPNATTNSVYETLVEAPLLPSATYRAVSSYVRSRCDQLAERNTRHKIAKVSSVTALGHVLRAKKALEPPPTPSPFMPLAPSVVLNTFGNVSWLIANKLALSATAGTASLTHSSRSAMAGIASLPPPRKRKYPLHIDLASTEAPSIESNGAVTLPPCYLTTYTTPNENEFSHAFVDLGRLFRTIITRACGVVPPLHSVTALTSFTSSPFDVEYTILLHMLHHLPMWPQFDNAHPGYYHTPSTTWPPPRPRMLSTLLSNLLRPSHLRPFAIQCLMDPHRVPPTHIPMKLSPSSRYTSLRGFMTPSLTSRGDRPHGRNEPRSTPVFSFKLDHTLQRMQRFPVLNVVHSGAVETIHIPISALRKGAKSVGGVDSLDGQEDQTSSDLVHNRRSSNTEISTVDVIGSLHSGALVVPVAEDPVYALVVDVTDDGPDTLEQASLSSKSDPFLSTRSGTSVQFRIGYTGSSSSYAVNTTPLTSTRHQNGLVTPGSRPLGVSTEAALSNVFAVLAGVNAPGHSEHGLLEAWSHLAAHIGFMPLRAWVISTCNTVVMSLPDVSSHWSIFHSLEVAKEDFVTKQASIFKEYFERALPRPVHGSDHVHKPVDMTPMLGSMPLPHSLAIDSHQLTPSREGTKATPREGQWTPSHQATPSAMTSRPDVLWALSRSVARTQAPRNPAEAILSIKKAVCAGLQWRVFTKPNTIIISEGERTDSLIILFRGLCRVEKSIELVVPNAGFLANHQRKTQSNRSSTKDSSETSPLRILLRRAQIKELTRGEMLTDIPTLLGIPSPITVVTQTAQTECLVISRRALMSAAPRNLLRMLANTARAHAHSLDAMLRQLLSRLDPLTALASAAARAGLLLSPVEWMRLLGEDNADSAKRGHIAWALRRAEDSSNINSLTSVFGPLASGVLLSSSPSADIPELNNIETRDLGTEGATLVADPFLEHRKMSTKEALAFAAEHRHRLLKDLALERETKKQLIAQSTGKWGKSLPTPLPTPSASKVSPSSSSLSPILDRKSSVPTLSAAPKKLTVLISTPRSMKDEILSPLSSLSTRGYPDTGPLSTRSVSSLRPSTSRAHSTPQDLNKSTTCIPSSSLRYSSSPAPVTSSLSKSTSGAQFLAGTALDQGTKTSLQNSDQKLHVVGVNEQAEAMLAQARAEKAAAIVQLPSWYQRSVIGSMKVQEQADIIEAANVAEARSNPQAVNKLSGSPSLTTQPNHPLSAMQRVAIPHVSITVKPADDSLANKQVTTTGSSNGGTSGQNKSKESTDGNGTAIAPLYQTLNQIRKQYTSEVDTTVLHQVIADSANECVETGGLQPPKDTPITYGSQSLSNRLGLSSRGSKLTSTSHLAASPSSSSSPPAISSTTATTARRRMSSHSNSAGPSWATAFFRFTSFNGAAAPIIANITQEFLGPSDHFTMAEPTNLRPRITTTTVSKHKRLRDSSSQPFTDASNSNSPEERASAPVTNGPHEYDQGANRLLDPTALRAASVLGPSWLSQVSIPLLVRTQTSRADRLRLDTNNSAGDNIESDPTVLGARPKKIPKEVLRAVLARPDDGDAENASHPPSNTSIVKGSGKITHQSTKSSSHSAWKALVAPILQEEQALLTPDQVEALQVAGELVEEEETWLVLRSIAESLARPAIHPHDFQSGTLFTNGINVSLAEAAMLDRADALMDVDVTFESLCPKLSTPLPRSAAMLVDIQNRRYARHSGYLFEGRVVHAFKAHWTEEQRASRVVEVMKEEGRRRALKLLGVMASDPFAEHVAALAPTGTVPQDLADPPSSSSKRPRNSSKRTSKHSSMGDQHHAATRASHARRSFILDIANQTIDSMVTDSWPATERVVNIRSLLRTFAQANEPQKTGTNTESLLYTMNKPLMKLKEATVSAGAKAMHPLKKSIEWGQAEGLDDAGKVASIEHPTENKRHQRDPRDQPHRLRERGSDSSGIIKHLNESLDQQQRQETVKEPSSSPNPSNPPPRPDSRASDIDASTPRYHHSRSNSRDRRDGDRWKRLSGASSIDLVPSPIGHSESGTPLDESEDKDKQPSRQRSSGSFLGGRRDSDDTMSRRGSGMSIATTLTSVTASSMTEDYSISMSLNTSQQGTELDMGRDRHILSARRARGIHVDTDGDGDGDDDGDEESEQSVNAAGQDSPKIRKSGEKKGRTRGSPTDSRTGDVTGAMKGEDAPIGDGEISLELENTQEEAHVTSTADETDPEQAAYAKRRASLASAFSIPMSLLLDDFSASAAMEQEDTKRLKAVTQLLREKREKARLRRSSIASSQSSYTGSVGMHSDSSLTAQSHGQLHRGRPSKAQPSVKRFEAAASQLSTSLGLSKRLPFRGYEHLRVAVHSTDDTDATGDGPWSARSHQLGTPAGQGGLGPRRSSVESSDSTGGMLTPSAKSSASSGLSSSPHTPSLHSSSASDHIILSRPPLRPPGNLAVEGLNTRTRQARLSGPRFPTAIHTGEILGHVSSSDTDSSRPVNDNSSDSAGHPSTNPSTINTTTIVPSGVSDDPDSGRNHEPTENTDSSPSSTSSTSKATSDSSSSQVLVYGESSLSPSRTTLDEQEDQSQPEPRFEMSPLRRLVLGIQGKKPTKVGFSLPTLIEKGESPNRHTRRLGSISSNPSASSLASLEFVDFTSKLNSTSPAMTHDHQPSSETTSLSLGHDIVSTKDNQSHSAPAIGVHYPNANKNSKIHTSMTDTSNEDCQNKAKKPVTRRSEENEVIENYGADTMKALNITAELVELYELFRRQIDDREAMVRKAAETAAATGKSDEERAALGSEGSAAFVSSWLKGELKGMLTGRTAEQQRQIILLLARLVEGQSWPCQTALERLRQRVLNAKRAVMMNARQQLLQGHDPGNMMDVDNTMNDSLTVTKHREEVERERERLKTQAMKQKSSRLTELMQSDSSEDGTDNEFDYIDMISTDKVSRGPVNGSVSVSQPRSKKWPLQRAAQRAEHKLRLLDESHGNSGDRKSSVMDDHPSESELQMTGKEGLGTMKLLADSLTAAAQGEDQSGAFRMSEVDLATNTQALQSQEELGMKYMTDAVAMFQKRVTANPGGTRRNQQDSLREEKRRRLASKYSIVRSSKVVADVISTMTCQSKLPGQQHIPSTPLPSSTSKTGHPSTTSWGKEGPPEGETPRSLLRLSTQSTQVALRRGTARRGTEKADDPTPELLHPLVPTVPTPALSARLSENITHATPLTTLLRTPRPLAPTSSVPLNVIQFHRAQSSGPSSSLPTIASPAPFSSTSRPTSPGPSGDNSLGSDTSATSNETALSLTRQASGQVSERVTKAQETDVLVEQYLFAEGVKQGHIALYRDPKEIQKKEYFALLMVKSAQTFLEPYSKEGQNGSQLAQSSTSTSAIGAPHPLSTSLSERKSRMEESGEPLVVVKSSDTHSDTASLPNVIPANISYMLSRVPSNLQARFISEIKEMPQYNQWRAKGPSTGTQSSTSHSTQSISSSTSSSSSSSSSSSIIQAPTASRPHKLFHRRTRLSTNVPLSLSPPPSPPLQHPPSSTTKSGMASS